jgi:hypothetical protein
MEKINDGVDGGAGGGDGGFMTGAAGHTPGPRGVNRKRKARMTARGGGWRRRRRRRPWPQR